MDKKPLIVVSLCAVVLLVVASLGNVVGYQTVQTPEIPSDITIDIITYKQRFPRIYIEDSDFNATIIITNNELNTIKDLDIIIILSQLLPSPRIPNEYEKWEFNLTLEPDEFHSINFSCNPYLQTTRHFGIFPLEVYVQSNNELLKYKQKMFIIYSPILMDIV